MSVNVNIDHSSAATFPAIGYRPDIDGLRAVAVVSVIVFHLSRSALPGEFLGVDIFFVISGFLITSIIWREARRGQFTIVTFYDRRIRRIMPGLLLLLPITSAFAFLLLLPADLIGYAKSQLATLAFSANIYFWRDTGYFSRAAEEKPLLHLWSLGVEEQFYLLFPLLLVFLAARKPRAALYALSAMTLVSLLLNPLASKLGVDGASFWLLPMRAWELGAGAILALLPASFAPERSTGRAVGFAGALLVLTGIAFPAEGLAPFPVAVPVVLGAAFILYAGFSNASPVNRALSMRPCVFTGLISYSLYLWHWPILVFGRYYLVRDFTLPEKLAASALMVAAATASWRYVELPFRTKRAPPRRNRVTALRGVGALAGIAALFLAAHGFPGRLNPQAALINESIGAIYSCPISQYSYLGAARACPLTPGLTTPANADVILLGNSHALMYAPLWATLFEARGLSVTAVLMEKCLPTTQANVSLACTDTARSKLAEVLPLKSAKIVVLGLTWWNNDQLLAADGAPLDDRESRALTPAIDDLIAQLQRAGKQVILTGPLAQPNWDIASILSRQLAFGHPLDQPIFLPREEFDRRFKTAIDHFAARTDIGFARPDLVQCSKERCEFLTDGRSLFADRHHLAEAELWRFRAPLERAVESLPIPHEQPTGER